MVVSNFKFTGGGSNQILEWVPTTGEWREFGRLKNSMSDGSAMSIVHLDDVKDFCT